jgi:hypothetical protein
MRRRSGPAGIRCDLLDQSANEIDGRRHVAGQARDLPSAVLNRLEITRGF